MVSFDRKYWQERLQEVLRKAAFRGGDLVLQVPLLRDILLDRLLGRLAKAYDETEQDVETLRHDRWFASHLNSFLHRLINQRPSAARAILRFLSTWVSDMSRRDAAQGKGLATPCTVVIEPTDRCNFNCPGCYAKSTRDGSDLTYQHMADIVEQVIEMGVTLITISGGEPFLCEKANQTLTRLAERFFDRGFLIYTNGSLIDQTIAARLGCVGNVFPAISVEGFEHQTDARRGHGVYAQNRQARRYLAENGVMAGFSATITRENCEAICSDAFLDLRIDEGDLFGWFFLLQPIGRAPRPDLMVTADQRAMLRETILRWRNEDRPILLGDFWNDGPLVGGCIAGGRYYFHIYANGDISPCVFAPIACGNIFDIIEGKSDYASLDDFVQHHPVFQAFRAEQDKITDRARPCLLIDHPEVIRRIGGIESCRPAKNFPEGYLDGEIARTVDRIAAEWKAKVATLPPMDGQQLRRYKAEAVKA